jgi:hypothetical protein
MFIFFPICSHVQSASHLSSSPYHSNFITCLCIETEDTAGDLFDQKHLLLSQITLKRIEVLLEISLMIYCVVSASVYRTYGQSVDCAMCKAHGQSVSFSINQRKTLYVFRKLIRL